jgi:hypothetical protein
MMKTFRRLILASLIAIVVLLGALYGAFRFLVPMSWVERVLERQAARQLHRELRLTGLRLGIRGVSVQELSLSEEPNFRAGTFAQAQGITLRWGLGTLLRGMDMTNLRPTQTQGSVQIDRIRQDHYQAEGLSLAWSLRRLDPSLKKVDGWIRLRQGPGTIRNLDRLIASSQGAKLALTPLLMIQNLEKTGIVRLGLPDLTTWPLTSVRGDYVLDKGMLKIQTFQVDSPSLAVGASGQIELPTNRLAVDVALKAPPSRGGGALDIRTRITGTLSQPRVDLTSLKKKAFQATLRDLLPVLGL